MTKDSDIDLSAYVAVIATPLKRYPFKIGIRCDDSNLTGIEFLPPKIIAIAPKSKLAKEVVNQIKQYFKQPNFEFDLPICLHGTDHQQRVWRALQKIPTGKPLKYGQLAHQLHSSARAVGNACRRNPIPIVVPCHRVVAKNGIGGFGGQTQGDNIIIKQWLLKHEADSLLHHGN